ncbi:MAG TPA: hypothetical protein VFB67_03430 [Candidatus Polarisedimenticolaceae bacterium]|nr:hypothetical protein [Candidatus Polarisedimenticolaceae bacterium]
MRLKTPIAVVLGLTLAGAAFAYIEPPKSTDLEYTHGPVAKRLVIKHEVPMGRPPMPTPVPLPPGFKPINPSDTIQASAASANGPVRGVGGPVAIASATPQQSLEMRLKSLARELR